MAARRPPTRWRKDLLPDSVCPSTSTAFASALTKAIPSILANLVRGAWPNDLDLSALDKGATVTLSESPLPWAPIKWSGNASLVRPASRPLTFSDAVRLLRARQTSAYPYLRFIPLDTLPELAAALPLKRALSLAGPQLQAANLLLGDNSLSSAVHFDDLDNLLLQLHGTKEVLLLPPELLAPLNYTPRDERHFVLDDHGEAIGSVPTGRLPVENHSPLRVFSNALGGEGGDYAHGDDFVDDEGLLALVRRHGRMCTLTAGNALFIPAMWSHAVRSRPASSPDGASPQSRDRHLNAAVNFWYMRGLQSFDRAVTASPTVPQVHTCRGGALRRLGRHAEAVVAFESAVTLREPFPYYSATHHLAVSLIDAAADDSSRSTELLGQARSRIHEAAAMHPASLDALHDQVGVLAQLGTRYARSGCFREAADAFESALRLTPTDGALYRQLARSHEDGGRPKRALAALQTAARVQPHDAETRVELAAANRRRDIRLAGGWTRGSERWQRQRGRGDNHEHGLEQHQQIDEHDGRLGVRVEVRVEGGGRAESEHVV
jgi:Flp pilus assembly protein TadD